MKDKKNLELKMLGVFWIILSCLGLAWWQGLALLTALKDLFSLDVLVAFPLVFLCIGGLLSILGIIAGLGLSAKKKWSRRLIFFFIGYGLFATSFRAISFFLVPLRVIPGYEREAFFTQIIWGGFLFTSLAFLCYNLFYFTRPAVKELFR